MINLKWREGLSALAGASRYIVKGVFQFRYTKTSIAPATGDGFGVSGVMDATGQGVLGSMDATGQGVLARIDATYGVSGIIDATGQGVTGEMDTTGQGVKGHLI